MLQEYENKIIEMLALIYISIPWGKIKTNKNAYDIFNHRVRAASRRSNLYEAISKLANYFGLQSLNPEIIKLVEELRPYEREVLNKIYLEHIPICMRSIIRAKEIKEGRK
ncbi:hypothetical protein [Marinitoga sp. 1138]|uniref:hypothetical protein n=1 Tax=Marinitoga sp. 1138 TaxID=1643334 RepID=UPI0015868F2B|nr:hypothetical protein [Marinitoga sp. 1138]NUU96745.1 hypothetical protein [Marinitoga sp. 1138]